MKPQSTKTLQILTGIFAVIYFALYVIAFATGNLSFSKLNDNLQLVLLLILLIGFALSWTSELMAGIIILIWNAGVWIFNLWLYREDDGGMFMGIPVMVFGALFILEWYKTSKTSVPSKQQQWKFVLRVLLVNYAVLYCIVLISELTSGKGIDYFSLPYILFPLLLLIFLVGFVISWKKELLAGYIFLFWCLFYIIGAIAYPKGILIGGPWVVAIIPILIQGLLYIKNHYAFMAK